MLECQFLGNRCPWWRYKMAVLSHRSQNHRHDIIYAHPQSEVGVMSFILAVLGKELWPRVEMPLSNHASTRSVELALIALWQPSSFS